MSPSGEVVLLRERAYHNQPAKVLLFFWNTQGKCVFFNKIFILFARMRFFLYFCREIINMEKIGYACTFDKR